MSDGSDKSDESDKSDLSWHDSPRLSVLVLSDMVPGTRSQGRPHEPSVASP